MSDTLTTTEADQDQAPHYPAPCRPTQPCIPHRDAEHGRSHSWLLVTDVDDTLLGNRSAFSQFVSTISRTTELAVMLNSSRPIQSLQKTISRLPTDWCPCGMIGALGTEIELNGDRILRWTQRFSDFDREPIDAAMARLECEPHDQEFQTPLKASFSVPAPRQEEAQKAVSDTGIPARIVRSGETSFDVIPEDAGKGAALQEVREILGVTPERTLAAGDSANDLDMLQEANAIVVGNATPKLKTALRDSDVDAYHATRTHAAGVLEGLQSAGVPLRPELTDIETPRGG
jgi:HAD superfamily hydrolase (TIGR01484 family)